MLKRALDMAWTLLAGQAQPETASDGVTVASTSERIKEVVGHGDCKRVIEQMTHVVAVAREAQVRGEKRLNLSRGGLKDVPDGFALSTFTQADLSYNRLQSLPSSEASAVDSCLEVLLLRCNHLLGSEAISSCLSQFATHLKVLDLSHNILKTVESLPFDRMPALEWLSLRHNPFGLLPPSSQLFSY